MILCAGLGTRLAPLTERWPKAAIPILGQPLFRFSLAMFKKAGATALGINTHHLAQQMEAVASAECDRVGLPLSVVREAAIQGTAGGIRGLRRLLEDDHFLVLNGDVLFPIDLRRVLESHRQSGALATMVVIPMPPGESYAAVDVDGSARVRRIAGRGPGGEALQSWHFTGVHAMSPAVFDFIAAEGPEDINREVYPRILSKGLLIRAEVAQGYWSDLGTPARYLRAQLDVLAGRAPQLGALAFAGAVQSDAGVWCRSDACTEGAEIYGPAFFDERCAVERGAIVGPEAYVGPGVRVAAGAKLKRVVVLENTQISGEENLADGIAWGVHRMRAAMR
jgi:mannose-1-phosphate guanylyltransferase